MAQPELVAVTKLLRPRVLTRTVRTSVSWSQLNRVELLPHITFAIGSAPKPHSHSQRTQIRLESALYRRSTSILARSSRNGPLGAVSMATLGDKTAVRPVNGPILPRDSAAHPRGEWPRGALKGKSAVPGR